MTFIISEKLATPTTQTSQTSIPYASRAEVKSESIQPEMSKGKKYLKYLFI